MLKKLGFVERKGRGKHIKYLYEASQGTKRIIVPVPKGRGDMKPGTLDGIRDRLYLNRRQFEGAFVCPFTREDYSSLIDKLTSDGKL